MLYSLTPAQFMFVVDMTSNFHMLAQTTTNINTSAGFKSAIGKVLGDIIFPLAFLIGTIRAIAALWSSDRNENWKQQLVTSIMIAGAGAIMTLAFYIFGLSGAVANTDTSEITSSGQ